LTYTSSSVNYGSRPYLGAGGTRSQVSGRPAKKAWLTSGGTASQRSRTVARVRPEGQEWEAFQEMFRTSHSRFLRLAYRVLRNQEDAEDAVQDALLSAYLHMRSFEGRSALTTWFTRIVLNAALMIRRKRKPSWIAPLPEPNTSGETPWTERIPASQPDPEMVYAEEETFRLIDVVLEKMSPVLRQAFTMTYYDEMSGREACALLGVSTGTFKSRLFRARRHLMDQAQRSLVAPLRKAAQSPFSFGKVDFQALGAKPAEISTQEIAFS
jgi:RNA polymerase sigma-70 factor (ECF subfamily)